MLILMASYTQIKISVEPKLAESFKSACVDAGVSMAAELSEFMASRTGKLTEIAVKQAKQASYDTRSKRRHHVGLIIHQLEAIKGYEEAYLDKIPENLQSAPAFDVAEQAIDSLEQAIDLLNDAY
jgi:hypothetical protein